MQSGNQPVYYEIQVHCACGSSFATRSTEEHDFRVEICSACHPYGITKMGSRGKPEEMAHTAVAAER